MEKYYLHNDYLENLSAIERGFEVDDDELYNMTENIQEPLNVDHPEAYTEITKEQFDLIMKTGIDQGVADDPNFLSQLATPKFNRYENVSGNSLSELRGLMREIKHNLDIYGHVSEYLPVDFIKSVDSVQNDIQAEFDRRENLL